MERGRGEGEGVKIVEGPRRFRYTVEVCLPDTLFEEAWHNKFAESILDAIKKHGGVTFMAENDNRIVKVKEIKATREN